MNEICDYVTRNRNNEHVMVNAFFHETVSIDVKVFRRLKLLYPIHFTCISNSIYIVKQLFC